MKEKLLNSKLILLIPAYWACLFDEIITIINQSDAYWKGNLRTANEGNPIGAFLCTITNMDLSRFVCFGYY